MRIYQRGFSLLEVIITLTIVGALVAIAYPSYRAYFVSSRRIDGKVALLDLSTRLEHYFTKNNTYVGASLANLNENSTSPAGYYSLQIISTTSNSFTVSASPLGAQAKQDLDCGTLTFNSLGQKINSGPSTRCWQ